MFLELARIEPRTSGSRAISANHLLGLTIKNDFRYKSDGSYDSGIETEKSVLPNNSGSSEVHGLRPGVYYQVRLTAILLNGPKDVVGHLLLYLGIFNFINLLRNNVIRQSYTYEYPFML